MVTESKNTKKAAPAKKVAAPRAPKSSASPAPASDEAVRNSLQLRRQMVGTVVSNKMQKTIVVKVDRQVRHALYKKYLNKSRKFKAHDENNTAKIGDQVVLIQSRPLSREKRWALHSILRKAGQAPELNI